jgi:NTE family protein
LAEVDRVKIGLVLGGGGFVGGAWLTGALEALEARTGVLPGRFDHVVGTSAGAMIGALTVSGVHPGAVPDLFAGRTPRDGSDVVLKPAGASLRLQRGMPNPLPSSARVAFDALRHRNHPIGVALAALLPRGFISTEPLREIVRQVRPSGWADHPGLWLMACDLAAGKRVAFGRDDAPVADLADAVAASCAIPSFYCPVTIGGRQYVDGGACSPSNLDVLRDLGLDLVLCFNPTSSLHRDGSWNPGKLLGDAYRGASAGQLEREAAKLRADGTPVLTVQPTAQDLALMGTNLMAAGNLEAVSSMARDTVAAQLDAAAAADFMVALESIASTPPARRERTRRSRAVAATFPTMSPPAAPRAASARARATMLRSA